MCGYLVCVKTFWRLHKTGLPGHIVIKKYLFRKIKLSNSFVGEISPILKKLDDDIYNGKNEKQGIRKGKFWLFPES